MSTFKPEVVSMIHEMRKISTRSEKPFEYGLEIEVIAFALEAMKNDSTLSISEAFECGCREWDV